MTIKDLTIDLSFITFLNFNFTILVSTVCTYLILEGTSKQNTLELLLTSLVKALL